ncbi:MAG: cobyrinate a,c-diamide synthase [Lachnospiraceae bacterium]|nr:cobyrinate a,c-diamide synthase [Lachnospiraceae bacterium]
MGKVPRVLFAAPKSGSGKTMITCGIIELLKRRNQRTASFKCGPDYIDPMFHRQVLGVSAGNLDTYFTDAALTRRILMKRACNADITVIEGVMGYYDGLGGQSEEASTYEVARITETPVILIVDAKGASVSLAAVIKGIVEYKKDSGIYGIILNRISDGYYDRMKAVIESACGIPVLGYLTELLELMVPSRHLGLIAPEEMEAFRTWIAAIADALGQTLDMEKLLEIARLADDLCESGSEDLVVEGRLLRLKEPVRLAVARDEAFSFYYSENMELLQEMGAELVEFSPIHDESLPEDIDGLLLGGGYPENFSGELEKNVSMRRAIRRACEMNMPCLAECGGFLYLQQELEGSDGESSQMAGVLPGKGFRTEKLCRFGYMQGRNKCAGVIGERGTVLKGHEFHYWDSTENGEGFEAGKPVPHADGSFAVTRPYNCMVHTNTMLAGFPHFYYYSNPQAIYHFLLQCQRYQVGRRARRHWDSIAKPIDSLGLLEDYVVKICQIAGNAGPLDISRRALLILCADHGVVEEGVTQTGQEVTRIVSENFAKGCSTVNIMAGQAGVDVYTVDVGMNTPPYLEKELKLNTVIDCKVARGTNNLAVEAAMSVEQCRKAIETGRRLVRELKQQGYRILATGEMGIGNTTPTSVLAAVFLHQDAEKVTGKGAGLSKEGFCRKCEVVERAVKRVQKKNLSDPVEILAEVGGYEIAAMAGVFLGGMECGIPVVIDGAISAVAALTAVEIDCRVSDYLLASHVSEEPVGRMALEALGLEAVLHGRMCLGEGTGAVALFPILDMAMAVYRNMGSFTDYDIEAYERFTDK